MEFFKYKGVDVSGIIDRIPQPERDGLPFGLIKLDTVGNILEYNMTESSITGRNPALVLGKNFFLEVAPCTQTPEFYGRFLEGVEKKFLNTVFEYVFDHEMAATKVKVQMILIKSIAKHNVWVIVKRSAAVSPSEMR